MSMHDERSNWEPVRALIDERIGDHRIAVTGRLDEIVSGDPERVLAELSAYKFAAKMIGPDRRVLDRDAGEGLGTWVLAAECGSAHGVTPDAVAAEANWTDDRVVFTSAAPAGEWDAVVALGAGADPAELAGCVAARGMAVASAPDPGSFAAAFTHVFGFRAVGELIRPGADGPGDGLVVAVKPLRRARA